MSDLIPDPTDAGAGEPAPALRPRHTVTIPADVSMVSLLGPRDELLRTMERQFPTTEILVRGNEFHLIGPSADVALIERLIDELLAVIDAGQPLNRDAVERSIGMLRGQTVERPADVLTMNIVSNRGRTIRPKTLGQKHYVDAIDDHTIVFGIGPAGTGKTYLAMAKAVADLQAKRVNRIILTRPAVEAGERLGFLPGTLNDKIDPYLRPLYDALHDMVDPESIPRLMAAGTIEVAPLAYMRGRAQPLDSQVLTPDGWARFGDLRVGDLVIGSSGMPVHVIGVHPQGARQVYRVTTEDDASTLACGEHLWTVRTPEDRRRDRWRTVTTEDMIGRERRGFLRRFELPLVDAVEFATSAELPIDPYAMGLLLGDGCLTTRTTPSFTTADPELLERLQGCLDNRIDVGLVHRSGDDDTMRHRRGGAVGTLLTNPVTAILRDLGLAGTRSSTTFVPEVYKISSSRDRALLLAGLLDTDSGSVTQAGRTGRVQYCTTSPRLKDDVVFLVRSLGGIADVRTRHAQVRTPGLANGRPVPDVHDSFTIDVRLPEGFRPFELTRRRAAYERTGGGRPMRHIDRIEPAGEMETMCIQVSAADSLYVTDDFILTHNTLNDSFIILDEAQNTTPEQMKMFLTRLGFGSKIVVTGDVTQVDLPGGTRSGLRVVREILDGLEDVHFAELTAVDVVRHRLVGAIVDAYGRWDEEQQREGHGERPGANAHGGQGTQGPGRGGREHRRTQRN